MRIVVTIGGAIMVAALWLARRYKEADAYRERAQFAKIARRASQENGE